MRYRVEILFDAQGDSDAVEVGEHIFYLASRANGRLLEMGDIDKMKMRAEYERGVLRNGERVLAAGEGPMAEARF